MDFGLLHEERDPSHFVPWNINNVLLWLLATGFSGLAAYGLGQLIYKAGHKLNVKANADVRSSWALERNAIANERAADAIERIANHFAPIKKPPLFISGREFHSDPFDPSGALTSAELKKIKATPGCQETAYRDANNVLQPEICRP